MMAVAIMLNVVARNFAGGGGSDNKIRNMLELLPHESNSKNNNNVRPHFTPQVPEGEPASTLQECFGFGNLQTT